MRKAIFFLFLIPAIFGGKLPRWVYGARVATPYDLEAYWGDWKQAVKKAVEGGATVILDWSEAGNSWKCLYDPCLSQQIEKIKAKADFVHSHFPGVKVIFYVAPLEYVTQGLDKDGDGMVDPDSRPMSLLLNHPAWIQMGISGRRAVFFGSYPDMPFWVCPTCEDAWLTPAHPQVRKLHIKQAERLALSGADGLWFDVPFLLSDYGETWVNQWTDLGEDARRLFKEDTGEELPAPPFTPDWNSRAWLKFVRWRYKLIKDFVEEYQRAVKEKNEDFLLAMETSVDYTAHMTQTASDPKDMAEVADLVAHEVGGVEETAQPYVWLYFLARLVVWRHTDILSGKPSWSLSYVYSWAQDLESTVKLHAASLVLNGFSYYTSGNETMSGVPDYRLRKEISSWMEKHRDIYDPSIFPYPLVAVVFSRRTLDYSGRGEWERGDYSDGFYGTVMLLLQSHIPFVAVHEDFIKNLEPSVFPLLILPDLRTMDDEEAEVLRNYVEKGGKILATEETSLWDELGRGRGKFALSDVFGLENPIPSIHVNRYGRGVSVYSGEAHEKYFFWDSAPWDPTGEEASPEDAEQERREFLRLLQKTGISLPIRMDAPPWVTATFWCSLSGMRISLVNLTGVEYGNSSPSPLRISIHLPEAPSRVTYTPFLGKKRALVSGRKITLELRFGGILELEGIFLPGCGNLLHFFVKSK